MTPTAFSRTFARLLADRGRWTACILAGGIGVLAGWGWWAARSQVTLYEVSSTARIELDAATYPIQSPLLGRAVETKLRVGRAVKQSDVLVEIDALPDRLQLREQKVRAEGMEPELARLRAQLDAEEKARAEQQRSARMSAEEAANRIGEAETAAKYAGAQMSLPRQPSKRKSSESLSPFPIDFRLLICGELSIGFSQDPSEIRFGRIESKEGECL